MKLGRTLAALFISAVLVVGGWVPTATADQGTSAASASSAAKAAPIATTTAVTKAPKTAVAGKAFTVSGAIKPGHSGAKVEVQQYRSSKWVAVGKATTTAGGKFSISAKLSGSGKAKLRVVTTKAAGFASSKSKSLSVTVLSAASQKAVSVAKAQVGKAYRHGAAGPKAFDCSGLTSYAYKAAGVKLPRTSRGQLSAGKKVTRSELQPGDLVFFYTPVSHVAIYLGGGKVVHAGSRKTGVQVAKLSWMPFSGGRRI